MKINKKLPVWYLAGPFHQYAEDVKALARAAGLRIIDANVTVDRSNAADPATLPQVTLRWAEEPLDLSDAPAILLGSNKLPAHVDLSETVQVQLGEVVAAAHAASGMTVEAWNKLSAKKRDLLLDQQIELMKAQTVAASFSQ